jgi:sulfite reductase (NADPH) flavoprotein alpha-component
MDASTIARSQPFPPSTGCLTIVFATQTGNAESLAIQAADCAKKRGVEVLCESVESTGLEHLAQCERLLLIVSTYDDGNLPDAALDLGDALTAASNVRLGASYAVIALGDSSYEDFCAAGRFFDEQLAHLGARRALRRIELDTDFHSYVADSIEAALDALLTTPADHAKTAPVAEADSPGPATTRPELHPSRVIRTSRLSGPASERAVWHLEIETDAETFAYQPGDSVAIRPVNAPGLVAGVLECLGLSGSEHVAGTARPIRELLASGLELRRLQPEILALPSRYGPDSEAAQAASSSRRARAWLDGRDVIDVISQIPRGLITPEELVRCLRPLQTRSYSVASSPLVAPTAVHLLVSAVSFDLDGRRRLGTASSHLSTLGLGENVELALAPSPGFRLPDDPSVPVLMVGPGTGVAPFRGFLQHRSALGATGPAWLFCGGQHQDHDFLYRGEFERWHGNGLLRHLDFAASRDQPERIYVQNLIRGRGTEVADWLLDGAHVYVCGAARMAPDVEAALVDAIAGRVGTVDRAKETWSDLRATGRLHLDVY